jgi:hypothetical protein
MQWARVIFRNKKLPGFAGRFFISKIRTVYSPLPKRRDHHPARRGWVSVVSDAGAPEVDASEAGAAGAAGADGSVWLWVTGVVASGWALTRKLTFSRTVERLRAARSASCAVSSGAVSSGVEGRATCCP